MGGSTGPQAETEELAEKRTEWAKERTEEAEERTDWAQQRTLLAEERTFSAWVRTGITAVAAGLGIAKLVESIVWPWMTRAIGAVFIMAGAGAYLAGLWRYRQEYRALKEEGMSVTPLWLLVMLIVTLLLSAALAFVLLLET